MTSTRAINTKVYKALAERYPDEYHAMMTEAYQAEGREYQPTKSPEEKQAERRAAQVEKARAKLDALKADYPELADDQSQPVT